MPWTPFIVPSYQADSLFQVWVGNKFRISKVPSQEGKGFPKHMQTKIPEGIIALLQGSVYKTKMPLW